MEINLKPIAYVKNSRKNPIDDNWEEIISELELDESIPTQALNNISEFSHLIIIYYFNKIEDKDIIFSGRPRENPKFPEMGIFAQRKKDRPNRIGICNVQLLEHKDRILKVKFLDAIDGTPILDIKPVFKQYESKGTIIQPEWVDEMMEEYW